MFSILISVAIISVFAYSGRRGWRRGATAWICPFIALIVAGIFIFIKVKARYNMEGITIFREMRSFAWMFISMFSLSKAVIYKFRLRKMPLIGKIDGFAGAAIGVAGSLIFIWGAMLIINGFFGDQLFVKFPYLNGGLFKLLYVNNPLGAYVSMLVNMIPK